MAAAAARTRTTYVSREVQLRAQGTIHTHAHTLRRGSGVCALTVNLLFSLACCNSTLGAAQPCLVLRVS